MKQLKSGCWKIIQDSRHRRQQPLNADEEPMETEGQVKFTEVYDLLKTVVSKTVAENMSRGLVFYSILHLVNEKGIGLEDQSDLQDFTINFSNNVE